MIAASLEVAGRSSYQDGGRDRALAFLTDNHDRQLAEQGYDTPSFD